MMPTAHYGEAIIHERARVLQKTIDVSECKRIVARMRKLVRRPVHRAAAQSPRQYTNYPNLAVDLEMQCVMMVAPKLFGQTD